MEKVSIIIPEFNSKGHLLDCLHSVCNQTWDNLEIIIIDDGSTDQSLEACKEVIESDNRCLVIYQENHGVSHARNQGIMKSTGAYIMFVDDDDTVSIDMVEQYVRFADMNRCDVVIGGISVFPESGPEYILYPTEKDIGTDKTEFWKAVCDEQSGLYGYVSNKLYKASVIRNNRIFFDKKMKAQEDLDFALRVYEKCNRFGLIRYSGYHYNQKETRRLMPQDDLVRNQARILWNASKEDVPNEALKVQRGKIQRLLFAIMYGRDQWAYLRKIRKKKWITLALHPSDVNREIWFTSLLYKLHCMSMLKLYFTLRNMVRRVITGNS